jgi:hypothetical protein
MVLVIISSPSPMIAAVTRPVPLLASAAPNAAGAL